MPFYVGIVFKYKIDVWKGCLQSEEECIFTEYCPSRKCEQTSLFDASSRFTRCPASKHWTSQSMRGEDAAVAQREACRDSSCAVSPGSARLCCTKRPSSSLCAVANFKITKYVFSFNLFLLSLTSELRKWILLCGHCDVIHDSVLFAGKSTKSWLVYVFFNCVEIVILPLQVLPGVGLSKLIEVGSLFIFLSCHKFWNCCTNAISLKNVLSSLFWVINCCHVQDNCTSV